MSYIPVTITVPGSTTQIIFNNAGALGADADFTWVVGDGLYIKSGQPIVMETGGGVQFFEPTNTYKCVLYAPSLTGDCSAALPDGTGTIILTDITNVGSLVMDGAVTATNINADGGDLVIATAGGGIIIAEGSDASLGTATLSGGTVTVNTTKVTANSRIFLTVQSLGTVAVPKAIGVTARTASTSFTITSADATDTSVVAWIIVEPA